MVRPIAIQAWLIPDTNKAPGRPINSQPDISEAPAERPVITRPNLRPPNT